MLLQVNDTFYAYCFFVFVVIIIIVAITVAARRYGFVNKPHPSLGFVHGGRVSRPSVRLIIVVIIVFSCVSSRPAPPTTMVVANSTTGNAYTPTVVAQIRYLLQWFGEWSELERGDFLPVLVHGFGANNGAVNGLLPIMESLCKEDGRPLSLFKCRIKLFTEWVQTWSDDDKESFLTGVRSMDSDFAERYEQKTSAACAVEDTEHCNGVNGDQNPEELAADEVI